MKTPKVWLVCDANEGLGEAAIKYLLLRGQQVIAISAPLSDRNKAMELYKDKFPTADLRFVDLFNAPDTEQAVRQIVERYGRIDKLINIGDSGLLSMHVLSAMQKAGKGHIIQMKTEPETDGREWQPYGLKSRYEDGAEGIRYTVLGADLCFQSILMPRTVRKKH